LEHWGVACGSEREARWRLVAAGAAANGRVEQLAAVSVAIRRSS